MAFCPDEYRLPYEAGTFKILRAEKYEYWFVFLWVIED